MITSNLGDRGIIHQELKLKSIAAPVVVNNDKGSVVIGIIGNDEEIAILVFLGSHPAALGCRNHWSLVAPAHHVDAFRTLQSSAENLGIHKQLTSKSPLSPRSLESHLQCSEPARRLDIQVPVRQRYREFLSRDIQSHDPEAPQSCHHLRSLRVILLRRSKSQGVIENLNRLVPRILD